MNAAGTIRRRAARRAFTLIEPFDAAQGKLPVVRKRKRTAFTLIELMIALGILAVGVSMAAAMFPLATKNRVSTIQGALGEIICRNALGIAMIGVPAEKVTSATLSVIADEAHTSVLSAQSQRYDSGDSRECGFVLLGRSMGAGKGRQLIVAAYRKLSGGQVTAEATACNVPAGSTSITGAAGLRTGSPLIDEKGRYAMIVSTNETGTEGKLDHPLSDSEDVTSAFVIVESTEARFSPAIGILMNRTALRK